MARKIVNVSKISREEWLEYRRRGIGGSDASTVVGLNPYRSRMELYADKLGLIPEKEDNEAMRVGRDLEDYVARRFCEATGKKVRRNNFMFCHDKHDFLIADVDRELLNENAGLECKTTSVWNKSDFENGEIPLNYYVQCMHYMMVMGYDRMYLAVLILGKGFYWFTIERNEEEISSLMTAEISFWRGYVVPKVSPSPDGSDSAQRAISAVWGKHNEDVPEVALFEHENQLKELMEVKRQIADLKKYESSLKQDIQGVMRECGRGFTDRFIVTWLPQTRTNVDTDKLKNCYPEAYQQCVSTSESRNFKIKENKVS